MWRRVFAHLLMWPRFGVYRRLLMEAADYGYIAHSVQSFWQLIRRGVMDRQARYLVLRHDVDADPVAAEIMWRIEQSLGVRASYYFRLATLDVALMQRIELSGSEASYHYEEIATYAKHNHLKTPEQVRRAISAIRDQFRENLQALREKTGLPMVTVASHGDFVNRKLGVYNWEILGDDALRQELGIDLEVYDEAVMRHVTSRHHDCLQPRIWVPEDPLVAVHRGERVIYVLTHPQHWRRNPGVSLTSGRRRLREGVTYLLGRRRGPWPLPSPTPGGHAAPGGALEFSADANSEGINR